MGFWKPYFKHFIAPAITLAAISATCMLNGNGRELYKKEKLRIEEFDEKICNCYIVMPGNAREIVRNEVILYRGDEVRLDDDGYNPRADSEVDVLVKKFDGRKITINSSLIECPNRLMDPKEIAPEWYGLYDSISLDVFHMLRGPDIEEVRKKTLRRSKSLRSAK